MQKKNIVVLFLLGLSSLVSAQNNFKPSLLKTFVEVYFEEKTFPEIDNNKLFDLFQSYHITPEKYRTIVNTQSNDSVQNLKNDLERLELKYKKEQAILLKKACQNRDIRIGDYNQIKENYRNNLNFHRSMKPYFDAYIKSLNK